MKAVLHYFYQENTRSGAHCRYDLKYHLVWIPKYRRSLLTEDLTSRLKEILYEVAKEYQFQIITVEVMPDHIHLLLEAPPKYPPSAIAGIIKGISSHRMRAEFLDVISKHVWKENTLWARGYYIASVADGITTEIVKEYIENQGTNQDENKGPSEKVYTQLTLF